MVKEGIFWIYFHSLLDHSVHGEAQSFANTEPLLVEKLCEEHILVLFQVCLDDLGHDP